MATSSSVGTIRATLLTRAHCVFCDDAKAILHRLAREYPLTLEIVDMDSGVGEQLALRGGMLFPPGIFLDGEPFSYGRPSERKLRRELERRGSNGSTWATKRRGPTGRGIGLASPR